MAAAYTVSLSPISIVSSTSNSRKPIPSSLSQTPKSSFLGAQTLSSIKPIISLPHKQTLRCPSSAVISMLPTAKPSRAPEDKIPKWSARSIKSFGMAELEARKLKYPTTGTEALLMGILVEGTSETAKYLRANGVTLSKVREETIKLLGKSDMYFFSPEHPPLTEPAQRALDWAVNEKTRSGDNGEVTTSHMLRGIWAAKDSAGHKILATLGFDDKKASELVRNANKVDVMSCR